MIIIKLLIHMCCAPCSVYPVDVLRGEGIELEGLFYNPNIHPREEFMRRRENVEKFACMKGVPVEYSDDFMQDKWEGFEGGSRERCAMCYALRLEKAASCAAERGFDAFITTLLVSPYQMHDLIKELGEKYARNYGVGFHYRDFRPGFRQGQRLAKEMGLYRQKYCGCIVSRNDRQEEKR